jgi:hypothetical protein
MARLILYEKKPKRKRVWKGEKSLALDPKPDDLFLNKVKFFERKMEAWTSPVYMRLDDSGIGVKSHSNLAMAGSCRNMPKYSLFLFTYEVKYG